MCAFIYVCIYMCVCTYTYLYICMYELYIYRRVPSRSSVITVWSVDQNCLQSTFGLGIDVQTLGLYYTATTEQI